MCSRRRLREVRGAPLTRRPSVARETGGDDWRAYVRLAVDKAPPLGPEVRTRLRALLSHVEQKGR